MKKNKGTAQPRPGAAKPAAAPTTRGQKIAAIASIAVFVVMLVLLTIFVGGPIVKTIRDPASFRAWIDARGFWGKMIFIGLLILQVVIAFIPGEPFELAAGYAFGAVWGTILVWIGLALGTTIVFLFVRKIGVKAVEVFFPREKINSMKYLRDEKALNAAAFVLFLIPGTPKDLLTYFAGLTKIRLLPWIVLTSIARIPSIVTSTISGNALGLQNYTLAIILYSATALVSGICILLYQRAQQKHAFAEAALQLAAQPLAEFPVDLTDESEQDSVVSTNEPSE